MKIAAAALLGLVAAGCGGSDGINEPQSVAGTYTLRTVNGAALPFVAFETAGYKLEVTGASYVLAASGTFTNSVSFRETEGGAVTTSTETLTGQYTVSGTTITFTDTDGDVITGSLSGNTLQLSGDGITAVFVR
ncbi:MAG: hypothetical protein ACR2L6_10795 [Gemmatimonadaceae bacterium]